MIVFFLFLGILANAQQQTDTIEVNIDWNGIKAVPVADGSPFLTLDVASALYLPEYNYLPVIEYGISNRIIQKVEIVDAKFDSTNENESAVIDRLISGFPAISFRNIKLEGQITSSILIFTLSHDESSGRFSKLTSVRIAVNYMEEEFLPKTTVDDKRIATSPFSENQWYKIGILKDGVYKLTKSFLDQLGIDADRINPRKIKILGNGGGMLPQANSAFRYDGINENAILVVGENDGIFDDEDYVLFYGSGQHTVGFDDDGEIQYSHNLYCDTTFYFISAEGADGLRLTTAENIDGTFPMVNTYNDLQVHELDENNILRSGREWVGERFDAILSRNYSLNTENIVPGSVASLTVSAVGLSETETGMDVSYDGVKLGEVFFPAIPVGSYLTKGFLETESFEITQAGESKNETIINLSFKKINTGRSSAYLNYFIFSCEKQLRQTNEQMKFRSLKSLANPFSTFQIANVSSNMIWDVTDHIHPKSQVFTLNNGTAIFKTTTSELKEFISFNPNKAPAPISLGIIHHQNLRGLPVPDLIIVSHPDFLTEAKRLADHRTSHDNLDVLVVTTHEIYNEFSSGAQDVSAIRDFVKYLYDKGNQVKLKNLLLVGRGSFDYKARTKNNTNFVPLYSSRSFLHPVTSYSSDDYYAFLEDGEGEWVESFSGDQTMDIGVGRLPVKTNLEAKALVDKLINYSINPETLGEWKNEIFFVADDGDGNLHQRDADKLATLVDTTYTNFNVNKIYVDAFEQVITTSGEAAPEANIKINNSIEKGGVIFNFTGHGSETRWCSETILSISMINKWENYHRLPLFVTATCEFGRHDDPIIISGGERLLLNPQGGAIGLITTARPVYSNSNYEINRAFYESIFEKEGSKYQDLGTVFMHTKNNSLRGSQNRNFILLGDPSMKLAFPENEIQIEADIENAIKSPGDTLAAFEKIKLKGNIHDTSHEIFHSFNGVMTATVFDKQLNTLTLGNEGTPFYYKTRKSIIFKGDVSVQDGAFEFEFVVPKNISYELEKGKVSLYAQNQSGQDEAAGADISFVIGGTSEHDVDNTLPEISLFMNDTSFVNGGLTGSDVKALAYLFDENGISILHDGTNDGIILSLDNGEFNYVGDFYKSDKDSYKKGLLNYPLSNLEEGFHSITVGAYDTHNNYNEDDIEFYVMESKNIFADKLINFPNPLRDYTNFSFEHNRAGEDLELNLQIYDINGRSVFNGYSKIENSTGKIDNIHWNARSSGGKKMEPGVYVYMIGIRSLRDDSNYFLKSKLLIIN